MMRIALALCACTLLLSGCMPSTKTVVIRHYTLGSTPVTSGTAQAAGHASCGTLQMARITMPTWLAGSAMYYRLDYRQDNELAAYAHSDWVAPPATLLEPSIQRTIAAHGCWRAVVGPRNAVAADATLHLRIDDFSQAFAAPGQSTGVIAGTATLIDNHSHRVIAQQPFHLEAPAATADAAGGAIALASASTQLAAHLASWLRAAVGHATNAPQ